MSKKPMSRKEIQDEADFAVEIFKDRAEVNLQAQAALAVPTGSTQITIRLGNGEIALARQQAKKKGMPYQTYIKALLHEALEREKRI